MTTSKSWLAIALSIAALAPAHANVVVYDVSGTVASLTDPTNQFGSPDPGTSFELRYLADFSLGYRGGSGGSFGSTNQLTGGAFYIPVFPDSEFTVSPVSATLTINGHSLIFSGEYFGRVIYTESFTFGFSRAELSAQSNPDRDGTALNQITTHLDSVDPETFGSVAVPGSWIVDGQIITGSTDFTYWMTESGAGSIVSGTLNPTAYAVTPAVPESSTSGMLLLGLVVLAGVQSRRPTRRSAPT